MWKRGTGQEPIAMGKRSRHGLESQGLSWFPSTAGVLMSSNFSQLHIWMPEEEGFLACLFWEEGSFLAPSLNFQHQFLFLLVGNQSFLGDLQLWSLGVRAGESKGNVWLIKKDSPCSRFEVVAGGCDRAPEMTLFIRDTPFQVILIPA